jgi:polygalacturonase
MKVCTVLVLLSAALAQAIQSPSLTPRGEGDAQTSAIALAKAGDEAFWSKQAKAEGRRLCVVFPNIQGEDDAPAIMNALNWQCHKDSLVVFPGQTYNIQSNMTTTGMENVAIHQFGRFVWSTNIEYWLSVSMPVGFQNQSTVWYFGGDRITWDGHGVGALDGNGQVWYDWAKSQGNLPRRPMMINWRKMSNSVVRGMRFVQSQMWTMAVTYSKNIEFTDIYVNNTSASKWSTLNTDGVDTIYSDNITFRRWDITSGDDAIALKGNSSNIFVYDTVIHGGQGLAIGSMGQYKDKYEYVSNFYARNLTLYNTAHAIYLKTWGGVSRGYPPNGGGGGLGDAYNITIEDIKLEDCRQYPLFAWQCENYEGHLGEDCQTSKFKMRDFTAKGVSGWTNSDVAHAGWFQCSAKAGGCDNFTVEDYHVSRGKGGKPQTAWHCENVNGRRGFTCTN